MSLDFLKIDGSSLGEFVIGLDLRVKSQHSPLDAASSGIVVSAFPSGLFFAEVIVEDVDSDLAAFLESHSIISQHDFSSDEELQSSAEDLGSLFSSTVDLKSDIVESKKRSLLVRRNPEVDVFSVVLSSVSKIDPSISSRDGDVGVDVAIAGCVVSSADSAVVVNEARSGNHVATVASVVKSKANSANVLVFVVSETSSAIVDGGVGLSVQNAVVASIDVSVFRSPDLSSAIGASVVLSTAHSANIQDFTAFNGDASSAKIDEVRSSGPTSAVVASVIVSTALVANVEDSSSVGDSMAISAGFVVSVANSASVIDSSSKRDSKAVEASAVVSKALSASVLVEVESIANTAAIVDGISMRNSSAISAGNVSSVANSASVNRSVEVGNEDALFAVILVMVGLGSIENALVAFVVDVASVGDSSAIGAGNVSSVAISASVDRSIEVGGNIALVTVIKVLISCRGVFDTLAALVDDVVSVGDVGAISTRAVVSVASSAIILDDAGNFQNSRVGNVLSGIVV